jgi:hypothetical protein
MDWVILIFLAVVAGVVIGIIQVIHTSNKKKGMEEKLASLDDFTPSQKIMGNDGNSGIAVDEGRKKVCLIKQNMGTIGLDVLTYRDILSSEVFEDGVTITKTARGSQIGGALIGGLALGGVGAIIGGLSGKRTSSDKVTRIDLRITVNRTSNPIHDINFMNVEHKKNGIIYNAAIGQARHWHGLLAVLIKRADSEDIAKEGELVEVKTNLLPKGSVADELVKLSELQKQGLLTDEEFKAQKAKLLA